MRDTSLHPSWRSPIVFAFVGTAAVCFVSFLILDGGRFARTVAAFMAGAWALNTLIILRSAESPSRSAVAAVRVSWLFALLMTAAYRAWRGG